MNEENATQIVEQEEYDATLYTEPGRDLKFAESEQTEAQEEPQKEDSEVIQSTEDSEPALQDDTEGDSVNVEVKDGYTDAELIELMDKDPNSILTERMNTTQLAFYRKLNAPITRKSQELSQKIKEFNRRMEELDTINAPRPQIKSPNVDAIDHEAQARALRELGLNEKPDMYDDNYEKFIFRTADHRQAVKQEVQQTQYLHQQINSRMSDPYYNEIDMYALKKAQQMSPQEAQRIDAFSFWDNCRKEFYDGFDRSNQPSTQNKPAIEKTTRQRPNEIEPAGKGQIKKSTVDYDAMSPDDFDAYMEKIKNNRG